MTNLRYDGQEKVALSVVNAQRVMNIMKTLKFESDEYWNYEMQL